MAREAFTNPTVLAEIAHFSPVLINGPKGDGIALKAKYKVPGYPTFLILDPAGAEVDRKVGYMTPPEVTNWLGSVRSGKGTFAAVEAAFKANSEDPAAIAAYAGKLGDRQDDAALPLYEKLLALDPENSRGYREDALSALAYHARLVASREKKDSTGEELQLHELMAVAKKPDSIQQAYGRLASIRFRAAKALKKPEEAEEKKRLTDEGLGYMKTMIGLLPPKHVAYADSLNDYAYYLLEYGKNIPEATRIAERAVKASRDPYYLDTLASAYDAAGRYDRAITLQQEALRMQPDDEQLQTDLKNFKQHRADHPRKKAKK